MTLDPNLHFNIRLRCVRHLRGLTIKALAGALGLHWVTVSKIERGITRPSETTRQRAALTLADPKLLDAPWIDQRPAKRPVTSPEQRERLRSRGERSPLRGTAATAGT